MWVLAMAPIPVFLLLFPAALFEVLMMAMRVIFPMLVVHRFTTPPMAVVIIGIIVSSMDRAADGEAGGKG